MAALLMGFHSSMKGDPLVLLAVLLVIPLFYKIIYFHTCFDSDPIIVVYPSCSDVCCRKVWHIYIMGFWLLDAFLSQDYSAHSFYFPFSTEVIVWYKTSLNFPFMKSLLYFPVT